MCSDSDPSFRFSICQPADIELELVNSEAMLLHGKCCCLVDDCECYHDDDYSGQRCCY